MVVSGALIQADLSDETGAMVGEKCEECETAAGGKEGTLFCQSPAGEQRQQRREIQDML